MTEPISSPLRGAERAAADPMLSSNPASPRRFSIEDAVGAVAMALLALITFTNVVVRYLTNESFAWSEEVSVSPRPASAATPFSRRSRRWSPSSFSPH